ncbi:HalD/BesD family halogenase [Aliamphritea ceti]|uniref:HalD/BesD family halogenase n=1 Tax=Aliamphritea ceti TaxID=1524258 RepID=UPI0021C2746E|nr:hypothetical protein [Aliamphritea ceti]
MSALTAQQIIDHQRYPIADTDRPERAALIEKIQKDLAKDGCAVVKNFLSETGLRDMLNEAQERKDQAYYSEKKACNVYLGDGDPELSEEHPRNVFLPRTNGFITADLLTEDTAARILYHWEPLTRFLADCLGKKELFIYDDPVSNMIVNLGKPGQQFNWHYDTNEFTITMLLKPAVTGGHFEYVANLRTSEDECYDEVKKVLDGDRSRITRLELNAGDLQFFLGRFSLHQVTENTGDDDRLLLIMSFTEKPGVIGSLYRVKDLYGKVTDAHYENERNRVRADGLLD